MERRRMFGWLFTGAAAAVATPALLAAERAEDEPWLAFIAPRKHRAFLDIRSYMPDGYAFRKVSTLHTTLRNSFGAAPDDIGIAFGAGSNGLAHVIGPAFWAEYKIGAKVAGDAKGTVAEDLRTGNQREWGEKMAAGVKEMRGMGVRVLACRNTIGKWSRDLAAVSGETPEQVQAKLLAGLSEGVEPVPAMVAAAVLAQGRNLSYVAIG